MARNTDIKFMSLAINLAKKAEGMTSPNPLVGAVVVKKRMIIGKGFHKRAGLPHAEIEAILNAERKGKNVRGSTLYVTLEPCCHTQKRTPPCIEYIIKKGISSVVIGCHDANPKVSGKSVALLRKAGIRIRSGVLEEMCKEINEAFFKYITTGIPFIILKLAASLDGKIATFTGDSKWIGSESQRKLAHKLRNKVDAIMVGIETVLRDDPELTVRLGNKPKHQPIPIILDSKLRIPLNSRLLRNHKSPLIITTSRSIHKKISELERIGARILIVDKDENGQIDLTHLLRQLRDLELTSILIEGGAKVAASALRKRIVDKIIFFYAPKIIGEEGISMLGKLGTSKVTDAVHIKRIKVKSFGDEIVLEGYL